MIDGKVSAAPPCAADPHDAASQLHCTVKAPVYDKHDRDRQTDRGQASSGQRATGGREGAKSVLGVGVALGVAGLCDDGCVPIAQLSQHGRQATPVQSSSLGPSVQYGAHG